MDPITAAATIVTAACAIIKAIKLIQEIWVIHKMMKAAKISGSDLKGLKQTTPRAAFELALLLNALVSKLGRGFAYKLDGRVKRQVLALQPRLKVLMIDLGRLKRDAESGNVPEENFEKRRKKLSEEADGLKDEIQGALTGFSQRIGDSAEAPEMPLQKGPSGRPLKFCYGALLCQSGEADAHKLSVELVKDSPKPWGFVCKYCFLEVGDYSAVRFSHIGEPVLYSDMLAASHVMACPSFVDRRAYYKCLACYENHIDLDFPSASAFEKHMQSHPSYSFIKNETAASEATAEEIQHHVLELTIDMSVIEEDDDNYEDGGDTNVDTVELAPTIAIEAFEVVSGSGPEPTAKDLAASAIDPRQNLSVNSIAGPPVQGFPSPGASTRGASTQGVPTGIPTQGFPTQGFPILGAELPSVPAGYSPTPTELPEEKVSATMTSPTDINSSEYSGYYQTTYSPAPRPPSQDSYRTQSMTTTMRSSSFRPEPDRTPSRGSMASQMTLPPMQKMPTQPSQPTSSHQTTSHRVASQPAMSPQTIPGQVEEKRRKNRWIDKF